MAVFAVTLGEVEFKTVDRDIGEWPWAVGFSECILLFPGTQSVK